MFSNDFEVLLELLGLFSQSTIAAEVGVSVSGLPAPFERTKLVSVAACSDGASFMNFGAKHAKTVGLHDVRTRKKPLQEMISMDSPAKSPREIAAGAAVSSAEPVAFHGGALAKSAAKSLFKEM